VERLELVKSRAAVTSRRLATATNVRFTRHRRKEDPVPSTQTIVSPRVRRDRATACARARRRGRERTAVENIGLGGTAHPEQVRATSGDRWVTAWASATERVDVFCCACARG
jgi:hypothetical protein